MGKSKKKRKAKPPAQSPADGNKKDQPRLSLFEIESLEKAEAQLRAGLAPFKRGNFVSARSKFEAATHDEKLSDDAKQRAGELAQATRPERTALAVGLGCALLLLFLFVGSTSLF